MASHHFTALPDQLRFLNSNLVPLLEELPADEQFQFVPDTRPADEKDSFSSICFPNVSQVKNTSGILNDFPRHYLELRGPVYQPIDSLDGLEAHLEKKNFNTKGPEVFYPGLLAQRKFADLNFSTATQGHQWRVKFTTQVSQASESSPFLSDYAGKAENKELTLLVKGWRTNFSQKRWASLALTIQWSIYVSCQYVSPSIAA